MKTGAMITLAVLFLTGCSQPATSRGQTAREVAGETSKTAIAFDPAVASNRSIILTPSSDSFLRDRVYNPAATVHDGHVHLIFRAEGRGTHTGVLGLASSDDGLKFRLHEHKPVLRSGPGEYGVEDPRIIRFGDLFYLFFISVKRSDAPIPSRGKLAASIQLAVSRDLRRWERRGQILSPKNPWESKQVKAPVPVPTKIDGKYWLYYQGEKEAWKTKTGMAVSEDLRSWRQLPEPVLLPRKGHFDAWGVEPGVAVMVPQGIFLIYAGWGGDGSSRNAIGWALFDKDQPTRLLRRCKRPLLSLKDGHLFAEGLIRFKGRWHLYFGVRDKWIEHLVLDLDRLLDQKKP